MHFAFTDEQTMIAETATQLFAEAATSERTRLAMAANGFDAELWRTFTQELGLAGVALPESAGGAGLGLVELAILAEAAGRQVAALPFLASLAMAAPAIAAGGSDEQQSEWLPRLASGAATATLALGDEAFAATPRQSVAVSGDRLSGTVSFVPHGTIADLFVVDTAEAMFLVPRAVAGISVTAQTTMDQTRPLARVELDGVAAERLANSAEGRKAALMTGWIALAADALGGAQACLDRTVAYAKERVQFGRPIGSFQAVKHRLADMMVEIEQARSAVYWAACTVDEGSEEAVLAAHSAKAFACDAYMMCAGNMIQLHGGIGFTWEHDAHLFFKRARADQTLLGSPAWHREQIAKLIGLDVAA